LLGRSTRPQKGHGVSSPARIVTTSPPMQVWLTCGPLQMDAGQSSGSHHVVVGSGMD
jgi:hypothetical protein